LSFSSGLIIVAKNPLSITNPAYHTVLFDGVPVWRAQAWALLDARYHGQKIIIDSAIRDDKILAQWKNHGLRPGLHGQQYLYDHQRDPGFFPANPPNATSHAGFSDGNPAYKTAKGVHIPYGNKLELYQWGIDAVDKPGGDSASLVAWFNAHGYGAIRPYPTNSERHHFTFTKSPAVNARKRLAIHYATGK
jgi:hypothetical protein